jgi:hypothetical protein
MHSNVPRARLANAVRVAVLFFLSNCAANQKPRIIPELKAGKPVCLTMDWGPSARPTFSGRPAPDTLLLLPERGGRPGTRPDADARGMITLSPSQRDREGGGWTWWTKADTLAITGWDVTEEHLAIQAEKADASVPARWAEAMSGRRGTVTLQPYKCTRLPEPAP